MSVLDQTERWGDHDLESMDPHHRSNLIPFLRGNARTLYGLAHPEIDRRDIDPQAAEDWLAAKPLMVRLCELYEERGIALGALKLAIEAGKGELAGQIVIAPPSALKDRWSRRMPDPVLAMASGWMSVKQRARQSGVELPLVISDHADWDELTATIEEVNPKESWITHGSEEGLLRWCELTQRKARALHLVGRDLEEEA